MATGAAAGAIPASQEWRRHWPLVLAAMVGLTVGTLPTATLGLFMQPLNDEFGWSRTQVSIGLTIFALISLPLAPFAGMLVDRFGARRIVLPGLALSGACFAAFGLMSGPFYQWLAIWVAYTFASLLTRSLVFSSAISSAFTTGRGLALAVLLCGTALATAIGPTATRLLIAEFGWRGAYVGLGVGWVGFVFVLVLLLFRDVRSQRPAGSGPAGSGSAGSGSAGSGPAAAPATPGGLSLGEAMRNTVIQRIALAMFISSLMGASLMVHIVPMLSADGLSLAQATTIAAVLGIASIAGKLITGALIDRIQGSLLPLIAWGGPAIAYVLLLQAGGSVPLLTFAVFILGYCSGASLQLATYLTTRYGGLRNFGAIFGVFSSLMGAAAGVGPLLAGVVYDATGDYRLLLITGIPASIIAAVAVFRLGAYPEFAPVREAPMRSEAPATAV